MISLRLAAIPLALSLCVACDVSGDGPKPINPPQATAVSPMPQKSIHPGRRKKRRRARKSPPAKGVEITSLHFGPKGKLHIGFVDGYTATDVDVRRRYARVRKAFDKPHRVTQISPNGKLAVVRNKNHGKIVRVKDRRIMLEMNHLKDVQGINFSPDGQMLFVGESKGKIHVWKNAQNLEKLLGKDNRLENYLTRQQANFTADFGMSAERLYAHDQKVIFSNTKGNLFYWDISNPSQSSVIITVPPPVRSLYMHGDHLLVTTKSGLLGVASIKTKKQLSWAKNQKADMVASHPKNKTHFASLSEGVLAYRPYATGKATWSQLIEKGKPCGLSIDPKGKYIAACINNTISIHHIKSGKLYRKFKRVRRQMMWKVK